MVNFNDLNDFAQRLGPRPTKVKHFEGYVNVLRLRCVTIRHSTNS